jgi:hypothetical protein
MRVAHVEAVAGAGVVHVEARVVGHRPVIRRVVEALHRQHRPEVVAFGCVVVDDVEDYLEAGGVERLHHLLEFAHLPAVVAGAAVGAVRRQEADRVVAPVVAQAALDQEAVVHELVDGQQLDRGDAELLQVGNRRRVRQPGICAAQRLRHIAVPGGEALHVQLVDDGVVQRPADRAVGAPVELRIDDDGARDVCGAVAVVQGVAVGVGRVGQHGRVPRDLAADGQRVGVEQELRGVAAVTFGWRPRPVHAVAIALARSDPGQVAVPAERGHLRQRDAPLLAVLVEQTELDPGRDF